MSSEPSGTTGRLPLSFAQRQLWFLHQLVPNTTVYNVHMAYRVRGPLSVTALGQALTLLLRRHEILRATYDVEDGTPYQSITVPVDADVTVLDHGGLPPQQRDAVADRALAAIAAVPFDLATGPLMRCTVLRFASDDHVISLDCHHIVVDGWSMRILHTELAETYRLLVSGAEPDLSEPAIGYRDFVAAQADWARAGELDPDLDFWAGRLAGLPVLQLPTDRPRPVATTFAGDTVLVDLDPDLARDVAELAGRHEVSRFAVFAAAVAVVLARYCRQDDIPIGVPMLGRTEADLEDVVGLFTNMMVLRGDLSGDPTFAELLARIAAASLELFDHQDAPFEKVVERVRPVRESGRNPLFQVSVQVLSAVNSGIGLTLPGLAVRWLEAGFTQPMFDLNMNIVETDTGVRIHLSYATDLFDRWRIEAMTDHLVQVLRSVVARPTRRLSEIALLSPDAADRMLAAGRGEPFAGATDPVHVTIGAAAPDAVAAVCRGVELTYRELDRRSGLLARHIRAAGVEPGRIVAIAMDRDLDTLVAMLAVWRAGAAFTMLDPRHPANRLDFMLRDTAAPMLITRGEFVDGLPTSAGWQLLVLDTEWPQIETQPADQPFAELATRDSLAYVLYTSGSTGRPKGVLITHRALTCFLEAYQRTFDLGPGSRMLQLPALTFDMSQGEIWTALTVGATLVLVAHEEGQSPEILSELIRRERVTYVGLSPAMLSILPAGPYPDLGCVMSGADALPAELLNKWNLPGRRFVNLYGPTEAAVACTEYECAHVTWRTAPPIGRPELNRQLYVVDPANNLVPRGVPGELLIGGDEGLASGYLNQPELTAEKFVPDPFHPDRSVYRSGDLVRWTADWQIDFLGRIDNQVKLHGLRVELGEIEATLLTHPQVRMAAVLLRPNPHGDKQLVGYIAPRDGVVPTPTDLRRHLSAHLPEYMVPTTWVVLPEFSLTAARKIDRAALPAPATTGSDDPLVQPTTDTERRIAAIFGDVLGIERVGADANFFELNGNSLQAMLAISRINKTFGVKATVRLLYGGNQVSAIAWAIDDLVAARSDQPAILTGPH